MEYAPLVLPGLAITSFYMFVTTTHGHLKQGLDPSITQCFRHLTLSLSVTLDRLQTCMQYSKCGFTKLVLGHNSFFCLFKNSGKCLIGTISEY